MMMSLKEKFEAKIALIVRLAGKQAGKSLL
jgi:hypothetical protein